MDCEYVNLNHAKLDMYLFYFCKFYFTYMFKYIRVRLHTVHIYRSTVIGLYAHCTFFKMQKQVF